MDIDRGFVRIAEGLVHYRTCGDASGPLPLYMIHASPASSITLETLLPDLGESRRVIAPDTLGNGDSAPPALDVPEMEYYGDSVARVLDALGLDRVDLYGSHTGAHIACEAAIRHPDRVRRVVFDGLSMFTPQEVEENLATYAPQMEVDDFGRHLLWAWHFIRDQTLYFPYFKRDPDHARNLPMPPATTVNRLVVEVLKGLTTYHKGYRASFRHDVRTRLPLMTQRTLVGVGEDDPLKSGLDEGVALARDGVRALWPSSRTPGAHATKIASINAFLDA